MELPVFVRPSNHWKRKNLYINKSILSTLYNQTLMPWMLWDLSSVGILLYSVVSHTSHFNSPLLFPVSYEERQRELRISESFHFRKKYRFPGKGEGKKDVFSWLSSSQCIFCNWLLNFILYFQAHQKNIQRPKKRIQLLKRRAAKKAEENAELEKQISELQLRVAERKQIWEAIGNNNFSSDETDDRLYNLLYLVW